MNEHKKLETAAVSTARRAMNADNSCLKSHSSTAC
jgi:hypothetical protein